MRCSTEKTVYDCLGRIAENQIRNDAIATITLSSGRVTPSALTKILSEKYSLARQQITAIIRNLISNGELAYIYQFGSTYLELSFNRPRKVAQFVVLHPPDCSYRPGPDEVAVQIQPGVSFGDGRHPTTRLAIRGIERVLRAKYSSGKFSCAEVLDVGCGSGVLVIAAVRLGAATGLGIDIDACALAEARHNVRLNALEDRIEISGQALETLYRRFKMVTANLRFPSLKRLRSTFGLLSAPEGVLVVSGIRTIELQDLLQLYAEKRWECRWWQSEAGWAGAVLQRKSCRGRRQVKM